MAERVDVRKMLLAEQASVIAALNRGKQGWHPTAKGDANELPWREVIGNFLPERYCCSQAFVIDADGECSEQVDVLIHDRQYSPLLFRQGPHLYVPAESVYAVFEVRPCLSKGNLEYAGEKIASVRRLRRTSAPIPHAGGTYDRKEPIHMTGGFLCTDSEWARPFGGPFKRVMRSLQGANEVELGCVATQGAWDCPLPPDQTEVAVADQEGALIFFLLRLFRRLQRVGTVAMIDVTEYGSVLEA